MDNEETDWLLFGIIVSVGFSVIMTIAFGASEAQNTNLRKELADVTTLQQKHTAENDKVRSSCMALLKDPVVRRIMCNKDHI